MKSKVWAVLLALVVVIVVGASIVDTMNGRPLPVFNMLALAGYSLCYAIARLAEAWHIELWEAR